MPPPTFTLLHGRIAIQRHDHLAVLYRRPQETLALASFLSEGLRGGDLCVYLAPAESHTPMLEELRSLGEAPEAHLDSGLLRLDQGVPDFAALRGWTQKTFQEAEDRRVPALRWLEDGIWPKPAGLPMPDFFEFHSLLNVQVKHYPSAALCQYALDRTEPQHLFTAIAVHRHLLVGGILVRDNPFYIPAEKFVPLKPQERERTIARAFREVGLDVDKLLVALSGYGRLSGDSGG